MKSNKKGFLYGTLILTIGTIAVKLIGAFFKIPLTNLLGGVGMSYFNVAYDLYYPFYALFISGVPVAVSKLVSESSAHRRYKDARNILRLALILFAGIGATGSLIMFYGARQFAVIVHNPDASTAIRCLAPSLFFGCLMAALRGYWQGLQDMRPTAVSQVIEAIAKLVLGLGLAYGIARIGLLQFERTGLLFGVNCSTLEQAKLSILPFAAAGAILGVTCSTVCGFIYLLIHQKHSTSISISQFAISPKAATSRELITRLLAVAAPVCAASLIANITSFIDLISVMSRLTSAIETAPALMLKIYNGMLPNGINIENLAAYLYGCYSGLAVPIFNLMPSLSAAIGVSLLPSVSAAWAGRNFSLLSKNVSSALRVASMLAIPAGLGLTALAAPIMRLIYYSKPMEAAAIAPALQIMGVGSIFVALTMPINAVLQATGRVKLPLKLLAVGGLLKLTCNYILVAIPCLNIHAAPIGTLLCYLLVCSVGLCTLVGSEGIEIRLMDTFGKPFLSGIFCAISAWLTNSFLSYKVSAQLSTVLSIAVGVIIYAIMILFTRTLRKEDIFIIPGGEKFANILEKHNLLG